MIELMVIMVLVAILTVFPMAMFF